MTTHKLLVFTAPVAGREDEYNSWYNAVHIQDVVAVPGIVSGQRFKLDFAGLGDFGKRYLAIYDLHTDNPQQVITAVSTGLQKGFSVSILTEGGTLYIDDSNNILFENFFAPNGDEVAAIPYAYTIK